jgi:hypothetical protein
MQLPAFGVKRNTWSRNRGNVARLSLIAMFITTLLTNAHSQDEVPKAEPGSSVAAKQKSGKAVSQPGGVQPMVNSSGTVDPQRLLNAPVWKTSRPKLPAMAEPSVEYLPQPLGIEKKILTILDQPVNFDFVDATLSEVREHLQDKQHIAVIINKARLEEEPFGERADVNLQVQGKTLREGLKYILGEKDLTFFIRDDTLVLSAKADVPKKLFVRTYPVRDLVGNADADYELLRTTIYQSVGSVEEWRIDGTSTGPCSVSVMPAAGCLVIRQDWTGHDEVLELLRVLRRLNLETKVK